MTRSHRRYLDLGPPLAYRRHRRSAAGKKFVTRWIAILEAPCAGGFVVSAPIAHASVAFGNDGEQFRARLPGRQLEYGKVPDIVSVPIAPIPRRLQRGHRAAQEGDRIFCKARLDLQQEIFDDIPLLDPAHVVMAPHVDDLRRLASGQAPRSTECMECMVLLRCKNADGDDGNPSTVSDVIQLLANSRRYAVIKGHPRIV